MWTRAHITNSDQGFYHLQHQYPRLVGCTETHFLHAVAEMKVPSGQWPVPLIFCVFGM